MPVTANGYCTPNQLVAVLPGLIIGSSADVTSDSIQAEINDVATKIRGSKQRYPLISLNDHQSDLLGMINSPLAEAAIIRRRATDLKPENIRYAFAQEKFGKMLLDWYSTGKFIKSFVRSQLIDSIALATVEECCWAMADFEPTEDDVSQPSYPSKPIIRIWIKRVSAVVYSIAHRLGYFVPQSPVNDDGIPTDLTADHLSIYGKIVRLIVGSMIVRVQKAQAKEVISLEADDLLRQGIELLIELASGKHFLTLKP